MSTLSIGSELETENLAQLLASLLQGGISIGLIGDLGAGKTTLVRYLVGALGGSAKEVASPTYTLQYDYPTDSGVLIEHWDLYRLESLPHELFERPDPKIVRIIEWPDRCPEILRDLELLIRIELLDGEQRSVELSGPLAEPLVLALKGSRGA